MKNYVNNNQTTEIAEKEIHICPKCGKKKIENTDFCSSCGYKFKERIKDKKTKAKIKIIIISIVSLIVAITIVFSILLISGISIECLFKGHSWENPTCTEPKMCKICQKTDGKELGHDWKDANCTEPKTCIRCNETEGNKLGHSVGFGKCNKCGEFSLELSTEASDIISHFDNAYDYYDKAIETAAKGDFSLYRKYLKSCSDELTSAKAACQGYSEFSEIGESIFDLNESILIAYFLESDVSSLNQIELTMYPIVDIATVLDVWEEKINK